MKKNKNFIGKHSCPYCLHQMDSAVNEDDETVLPCPGDISICIRCGELSEFNKDMKMISFNIWRLDADARKDIRKKQYMIATIQWKEEKMQ